MTVTTRDILVQKTIESTVYTVTRELDLSTQTQIIEGHVQFAGEEPFIQWRLTPPILPLDLELPTLNWLTLFKDKRTPVMDISPLMWHHIQTDTSWFGFAVSIPIKSEARSQEMMDFIKSFKARLGNHGLRETMRLDTRVRQPHYLLAYYRDDVSLTQRFNFDDLQAVVKQLIDLSFLRKSRWTLDWQQIQTFSRYPVSILNPKVGHRRLSTSEVSALKTAKDERKLLQHLATGIPLLAQFYADTYVLDRTGKGLNPR